MNDTQFLFPLTPLDIEERAAIERRRQMEKKRQECLTIVDQPVLARQIRDKIDHENQERNLSEAYAHDGIKYDAIVDLLNVRQEHDRREIARAMQEFRTEHQRPKSVEDLHDGLANGLSFEGEDRNKKERERKQKEQMYRWIIEQNRIRHQAIQQQAKLDREYDCHQLVLAKRVLEFEAAQIVCRRQMKDDIKAFNRALANEKRLQRQKKETFELEDRKQEIENLTVDPVLTENRALTRSQFGPYRPLLTHWKDSFALMAQGRLHVAITEAAKLRDKDPTDFDDPFVEVYLDEDNKQKTGTIMNTERPRWNDIFEFDVWPRHEYLYINVYSEHDGKKPDLIGSAKIDLAKVLDKGEFDDWIKLPGFLGLRNNGDVHVRMTYEKTTTVN